MEKLFNEINNSNNFLVVDQINLKTIIEIKSKLELLNNNLFKFKIITSEQLINKLTFSIKDEIFLHNLKKGIKPSIVNEQIKFAKYNLNKTNENLNNVLNNNKEFLLFHNDFLSIAKTKTFFLLTNDLYLKPLLNNYKLKYEKINLFKENKVKIHKFTHISDEIIYVFNDIANLLSNKEDLTNIYIANVKDNYYEEITKVASHFNIPIPNLEKDKLYDIPYIKELILLSYDELIELLSNTDKLNERFNEIRKIDLISFDNNINSLISIINKYPINNYQSVIIDMVIYELKQTKAYQTANKNVINFISLEELITVNKGHIFIINASYESFPSLVKDNKYLADDEMRLINYPTSDEVNEGVNNYLKELINNPHINYISFSLFDNYNSFTPSDILINLGVNELKATKLNLSELKNIFAPLLIKNYFKTNEKNTNLLTTFNGEFKLTTEEREYLKTELKQKNIKLRPSSITRYYQSPFVYYLENIIKIKTFKPSVNQMIGNFFHLLMEVVYSVNFDFKIEHNKDDNYNSDNKKIVNKFILKSFKNKDSLNDIYINLLNLYLNNFINDQDELLIIRTMFFLNKNKEQLLSAANFLIELEKAEENDLLFLEKSINNDDVSGIADLVKIKGDEFKILDYKSSKRVAFDFSKIEETINNLLNNSPTANLKNLELIQVLIYSYLFKQTNPNYKLNNVGFFGYFENDFKINALSTNDQLSFYTKRKPISVEQEELIYPLINNLINYTHNIILDVNFSVNVLKDIDNKTKLEEEWFNIYQALAYFYDVSESEIDADE